MCDLFAVVKIIYTQFQGWHSLAPWCTGSGTRHPTKYHDQSGVYVEARGPWGSVINLTTKQNCPECLGTAKLTTYWYIHRKYGNKISGGLPYVNKPYTSIQVQQQMAS